MHSRASLLNDQGSFAVKCGKFEEALQYFSLAIAYDSQSHVLYSNRSATYAKAKLYEKALDDANKTCELKPDWPKSYSLRGCALAFMNRIDEAINCFEAGLRIDPANRRLQKDLEAVRRTADLKPLLADRSSVSMIDDVGSNPNVMGPHLSNPRAIETMLNVLRNVMQVIGPSFENRSSLPSTSTSQLPQPIASKMVADLSAEGKFKQEPSKTGPMKTPRAMRRQRKNERIQEAKRKAQNLAYFEGESDEEDSKP